MNSIWIIPISGGTTAYVVAVAGKKYTPKSPEAVEMVRLLVNFHSRSISADTQSPKSENNGSNNRDRALVESWYFCIWVHW